MVESMVFYRNKSIEEQALDEIRTSASLKRAGVRVERTHAY